MTPEQKFKVVRDVVSLATGTGIFILQGINNNWNLYATGACLVLMGVPLVNLRALFPNGTTTTQESQPQSQLPPSSTPSPPTSNTP